MYECAIIELTIKLNKTEYLGIIALVSHFIKLNTSAILNMTRICGSCWVLNV